MKADVLVTEIGSTTTVVNAFTGIKAGTPRLLAQGVAPTSVGAGDVTIGLRGAIQAIEMKFSETLSWDEMYASSSAAGGLRMSVHGLVYEMTVRAAREAALGSGAVLVQVTAGKLRRTDLQKLAELKPKIILLAGGVDYGERETALENFLRLTPYLKTTPLVYAGNIENAEEIRLLAKEAGVEVFITENVYPAIDRLNVLPTRKIIQEVFEHHIVESPGMEKIRELVSGPILPTPGAVMTAAELVYKVYGDCVVIDVGGATTDVHSVTEGDEAIRRISTQPEPFSKRTVEGDLGIFVNRKNVVEQRAAARGRKPDETERLYVEEASEIPQSEEEIAFASELAAYCAKTALSRHAGRLTERYAPGGRLITATGRDLTAVKVIVGTGGALTRLPNRVKLLQALRRNADSPELYPPVDAAVRIDDDYLMASLGVLSTRCPEAAEALLIASLERNRS
jgi:uncharacterized protein (TIGR01319 family)